MFEQTKRDTAIFRYKCNSTLLFFFYMGVNSIRPEKFNYCPPVPRGLNKKEAYISEQFLCVCSNSLIFLIYGYLMTFDSNVQMFFEDCVAPS